jgi:hypothetical protein
MDNKKPVKAKCEGMYFQLADDGSVYTVPYPDLKSVPEHRQDDGSYLCHICEKTFVKKSYYKQHVMSHMKTFECTICLRKFSHHHHLNQHMITHENPNSHECSICHKKFTYKFNLTTHMKRHIKCYDMDGNEKYL